VYLVTDQTQLHTHELEDIWQITERVFAIPPTQVTFASDPNAVPRPARDASELDRQLRALAREQDTARAAERRDSESEPALERAAKQARSSLTEAFTSHLPPSIGPAASTVMGILADALGESGLDRVLARFKRSSPKQHVDAAALSPGDVARLESELGPIEPAPDLLRAGLLAPTQLAKIIDGVVPAPAAPFTPTGPGAKPPPRLVDPLEGALIRDQIDRGAHPLDVAANGE
jgi:hypothetical protein